MALLLGSPCRALEGGYSAGFEPYPHLPLCPTVAASESRSDARADTAEGTFGKHPYRIVCRRDTATERAVLSLEFRGRTHVALLDSTVPPYISGVRSGDLNHDSRPDFVLEFPSMGCGLAGESSTVLVALSRDSLYDAYQFPSYGFGPEHLVRDGSGTCRIVQTDFLFGGVGTDGRHHGYWVSKRIAIQPRSLSYLDEPAKWIAFIGKRNHKETRLIPEARKALLVRQAADYFAIQPLELVSSAAADRSPVAPER